MNCKSANRSGAVFFQCRNSCHDSNNLFVNSSSDSHTGTFDDWLATNSIHSASKYINSTTPGHFGIINIQDTPATVVTSCIFVNGSTGLHAGLLSFTMLSGRASVSNCIFAQGNATLWGGGFGTYAPYSGTPRPYFYFSYFSNNVCSDQNRGADFDANGTTGNYFSEDKIIHCFSSSRGVRVYIQGKNTAAVNNWLN